MVDYYFDSLTDCKRGVRSPTDANFALSISNYSSNFWIDVKNISERKYFIFTEFADDFFIFFQIECETNSNRLSLSHYRQKYLRLRECTYLWHSGLELLIFDVRGHVLCTLHNLIPSYRASELSTWICFPRIPSIRQILQLEQSAQLNIEFHFFLRRNKITSALAVAAKSHLNENRNTIKSQ